MTDPATATVDLFRTLEQALRVGYSLRQALVRAAGDFDDAQLHAVAATADESARLDTLFDDWAAVQPDIALLAGAIRLQLETKANLADTLSTLHLVMSRRP